MRSGPSRWTLLHPRWLLLALFTVAVSITMILLGRWQWHAAIRHHGEILNYSYAFQWWAFTAFAVGMYIRIVRDHLRSDPDADEADGAPVTAAQTRYVAYVAPPSVTPDDADSERARFNSYLGSLYAADGASVDERDRPTKGTSA